MDKPIKSKFKVGDKVVIVKYRHPVWVNRDAGDKLSWPVIREDDNIIWYDMISDIVGKVGVVIFVRESQGQILYSVNGIPQKTSWYKEEQLDKFNQTVK